MPPFFAELSFPGWDPVAMSLGPLQVRWYGLAYLAGFLIGGVLLDRLVRDGFLPLTKAGVSDLIGWLVLSVLLGGRLGYAVFYDQSMLADPASLIRLWEGGLSFHGGLAGVAVGSWLFARGHRMSWLRLGDALALAVPPGILLVRCANFVNAELFGRLAPPWLPWGMRFPTDPAAATLLPRVGVSAGALDWSAGYAAAKASGLWAEIARVVPLRHPSQLYEALLEGVVIGLALWLLYRRVGWLRAREGGLASAFLLMYAAARFLVEFTREPDAQLGYIVGPFTMGQLLSAAVAVAGALLLARRGPPASKSEGSAHL